MPAPTPSGETTSSVAPRGFYATRLLVGAIAWAVACVALTLVAAVRWVPALFSTATSDQRVLVGSSVMAGVGVFLGVAWVVRGRLWRAGGWPFVGWALVVVAAASLALYLAGVVPVQTLGV